MKVVEQVCVKWVRGKNWTREEDRMTPTCGCEALISVIELPQIALLRTPLLKGRRSAFHSPLG